MAIDQGTTGTTVILVDHSGKVRGKAGQDYAQIYPQPGWVEHDPEVIWKTVKDAALEALEKSRISPSEIKAIGITNQRETVVAWDATTGRTLCNAIVWQCRRTTDFCHKLKKNKKLERKIRAKTGLVLDPYFSGTKMNWMLKNVPAVKAAQKAHQLKFGTIDCFLLHRLTGGAVHKTDVSNASRTLLMDLKTTDWSAELLKVMAVPRETLPEICDSSGVYGETKGLGFLPDGIPIAGMAGDQQSALFGQAAFSAGEAKCTFGTGSFLLMNTGEKIKVSKFGLLTTVAWRLSGQKTQYALEGSAFVCGAAVQWLRDGLGLIRKSEEIEALAQKVPDTGGVFFVPALTGMGAPYWKPEARGLICGLTRGSTASHIARATLEGMAFQNVEVLIAMEKDLGKRIKSLRVDGGATENNLLMQMQADFLGARTERPENVETTSLGAAFLAGLGVGFWKGISELKQTWALQKAFEPELPSAKREKRLKEWQRAVKLSAHDFK